MGEQLDDEGKVIPPCEGCGQPLVMCPDCDGTDPKGGEGQFGYYICKRPDCPQAERCCGC